MTTSSSGANLTRRDFLYVATATVAGIGTVSTLIPFLTQMDPDQATIAAGAPVDIDIGRVEPGQQIKVFWRSKPIFIVNRTPAILKTLQEPQLLARLSDPQSQAHQQPSYARNWHRSIKPEFLVLVGICTHLGCIPGFYPSPDASTPAKDWLGGYFCPCHGSKYDLSGRVFNGVPAPYNLPVPPYRFVNDHMVRIGENPPNENFDFGSIRQL